MRMELWGKVGDGGWLTELMVAGDGYGKGRKIRGKMREERGKFARKNVRKAYLRNAIITQVFRN